MYNRKIPSKRSLNIPHTTKAGTYQARHVPEAKMIRSNVATSDGRVYTRGRAGNLIRSGAIQI